MNAIRRAVGMTALVAALACPATAFADDYNQPVPVDNNVFYAQGSGAGVDDQEPLTTLGDGLCGTNGPEVQSTHWYSFRGTGGPMYTTTSGSNFDTLIAVYDGPAPAPFEAALFCENDRAVGDADSQIDLSTTEVGKEYLLQVGGCNDDLHPGACPLDAEGRTGTAAFAAVGNDSRSFPETIPAASPLRRTNLGASTEGGENINCGPTTLGKTVWFRYNATAAGRATFQAVGPVDTVLGVFRGGRLACNDDTGDSSTSQVSVDVTPGTYLVQVGGKGGGEDAEMGNFTYRVDFTPKPQPTVTPGPRPTPAPPVDLDHDDDGLNDDLDCDDNNPKRRQGLPEIRGNKLDEDCDGQAQDFRKLASRAQIVYRATASTLLRAVFVRKIEAGSTVRITCKGKGCGRKRFSKRFRTTKKVVNFIRAMRTNRPKPGAVLEIRITKPQRVGRVYRYSFRFYKFPRLRDDLCVHPGVSKPFTC
jgi:hypothetical protein